MFFVEAVIYNMIVSPDAKVGYALTNEKTCTLWFLVMILESLGAIFT